MLPSQSIKEYTVPNPSQFNKTQSEMINEVPLELPRADSNQVFSQQSMTFEAVSNTQFGLRPIELIPSHILDKPSTIIFWFRYLTCSFRSRNSRNHIIDFQPFQSKFNSRLE